MKKFFLLFVLFYLSFFLIHASESNIKVEKWKPTDFEFKTSINWQFSPTDQFEVDFSAEIAGPDNIKMTLPGFYDGNNTWKIRFAPTKEGEWTITTQSDVLELHNKQVKVECIPNSNNNAHGALVVDKDNPSHFIYEDGTRFFPVAYEANWLFAMDMDSASQNLPTLKPFLDKLLSFGFNFININFWAYDTSWKNGKTEDADLGPPALFPWEGTNDYPNFKKFNLKYWQHFDNMIDALYQRGIMAYLYLEVYNKLASWPKNNSVEDDQYFRYVMARYSAYSNVIWSLAKEGQYEKSTKYKVDRFKFIKANDPYQRLRTMHDDRLTYDMGYYTHLLNFRSSQEFDDVFATIDRQIAHKQWPILMAESGYEHGPKGLTDRTYGRSHTPEEVLRHIWNIQMTGVYNCYYYTYTAWDVVRHLDTPPGYTYMKHFSDFFNKTNYWQLKTTNSLVSTGRCRSIEGEEYIVYLDEATKFTFTIPQLPKSYHAVWFQPLTGVYIKAGTLKTGTNQLTPPSEWGKVPVVLHIKWK